MASRSPTFEPQKILASTNALRTHIWPRNSTLRPSVLPSQPRDEATERVVEDADVLGVRELVQLHVARLEMKGVHMNVGR